MPDPGLPVDEFRLRVSGDAANRFGWRHTNVTIDSDADLRKVFRVTYKIYQFQLVGNFAS